MKTVSRPSLALALVLGLGATTLASAPAAAARKEKAADANEPKLSKETRPLLGEAQTAIAAGDFATGTAKLDAATAVASTPDDKFYIAQFRYNIAQKQNDQAGLMKAVDAMVDSNSTLAAGQLPQMYQMQAQAAMQAKDYQKAEATLEKANALQPSAENSIALAEIKNANGKSAEALALVDKAIAEKKAAGGQVSEEWYKRALSIAYTSKNAPETIKWGQAWITAFPASSNWRNGLFAYRDVTPGMDRDTNLDLLRLARAAKALNGERDYYEYADYAFQRGLPGEAKAVVDEGYAAKMLDASNKAATEVRSLAAPKIDADKASLAASEKSAAAAANGKLASGTADAYLGYAQYQKAADLYKIALQKGGVDANTVNTRLGIALALAGQKDAAKQAFAAVTGPRQPLAQYWTIWVDRPAA